MEGSGSLGHSQNSQFISFQDFSPINKSGDAGQAQLDLDPPNQHFDQRTTESMTTNTNIGMMEELSGLPDQREANAPKSFWTLEYYQKFFNIDTNDVLLRIRKSMIPYGQENYLLSHIRPNPDLYGPFWVCITLIFTIAISGNIANYFQHANTGKYHWRYEFHTVSYAATAICLYVWLLPLGLWAAMKWASPANNMSMDAELIESDDKPGLLELLCLYGYSLSIFIPIAFLWTIPIEVFRWLLVGVATALSGGVLLRSLMPLIVGKQKTIYMAVILGMHLLLTAGFMLYFFHVPALPATDQVHHEMNSVVASNLTKTLVEATKNPSTVTKV